MVLVANFVRSVRNLIADCRGATIIEYALLAGLIAAVAAATVGTLGTSVNTKFTTINTKV